MEYNNSKTLSEFLKENGAYDAFIENCVEECNGFDSKEGRSYWIKLWSKLPEGIELDEELNQEIIKRVEAKGEGSFSSQSTTFKEKTLSEFLKENGAYESFIENCIDELSNDLAYFKGWKVEGNLELGNVFAFSDSKQGYIYWFNLSGKLPKGIEPDKELKQEIIKRVEAKIISQKRYMVVVAGGKAPKVIHNDIASARREASRLSMVEIGKNVSVVEIVCEFKSKVIIEEL